MFQHELKNAYIWEYNNKYVYDFTTKTIADLTTDWWTNISSSLAIDSNWIYNTSSWQVWPNITLNSSASESFTLKTYFRSTNVWSWTGTFTQYEWSTSSMWGTYYWLMTNSDYKLRWSGQYWSTSASNSITWSANTWYIWTHTVDLVNNTLTVTVATENAPDTALVTLNKDISSIIWNITPIDSIGIRLERDYVRCKKVEVTRS